jgi:uracil-DNA glycosylase
VTSDRPSFGRQPDAGRLKPEPHVGEATPDELRRVLVGYRALDDRSGSRYAAFLRDAARCSRCREDRKIPAHHQPLPLLCGAPDLAQLDRAHERLVAAHALLRRYRRTGAGVEGSLAFNPDDPAAVPALTAVLDDAGLAGLSIGHCGWSDLTMRVRGDEMRDGTRLMILGNDWYPLAQCANFLADRYEPGVATMGKFVRRLLGTRKTPDAAGVEEFLRRERVYLGNTLMCYRTGWQTTRGSNLSYRSFANCQDHLRRHLAAVAPRVVVTFGENGCSSVASVVDGVTSDDAEVLGRLQRVHGSASLGKVMAAFYAAREPRGIRGRLDQLELTFVPLYHPSYAHVNKYSGDYEALRVALAAAVVA